MPHKLDEKTLVTPTLLKRFHLEASLDNDGRFCAYVQYSNRDFCFHNVGPEATINETVFAKELLTLLNDELHHDGAWVAVFTGYAIRPPLDLGSYGRLIVLWMDKDGDVQFPIQIEDFSVETAVQKGAFAWLEDCEAAWLTWQHHMRRVLAPKPEQLFKRALGEKPPTLH